MGKKYLKYNHILDNLFKQDVYNCLTGTYVIVLCEGFGTGMKMIQKYVCNIMRSIKIIIF